MIIIYPHVHRSLKGSQSVYSTDSAEESEQERLRRKGVLGKLAHQRFESILRAQTGRRGDIARAMVFSLQHAEAASQVQSVYFSVIQTSLKYS